VGCERLKFMARVADVLAILRPPPPPSCTPLGTFVRAQTKLFRPSSTTLFTFIRKGSKQRVTATTLRSGMIGFQSSGISW
jgi:hypothetical protein